MSERRFGILIASSQFPEEPLLEDLRFPENDVDGLNKILTSKDYGQFTQTFVLKNKLHHEILRKINQVLREADKNDLVLIYYSGHGKLNRAGKLYLTSTNSVISVLEATSIPVSTIKDYIDISSSKKIILILDCCFSGKAGEEFLRSGIDDQLQLVSDGRGTYIMTASTGIQVAQEKESDQHGVFTKYVIEGIKSGDADLDCDGRITMDDLYRYVHDHVLDEGFQEPMKWGLGVRGELIIASSGKTPREERRKQIRELLFGLAKKEILPDDILNRALKVIDLNTDQLSENNLLYDMLLDQLLQKCLKPLEFIRQWDKVELEKTALQTREQKELKLKAEEEKYRLASEEEVKTKAEAKVKADKSEANGIHASVNEKSDEIDERKLLLGKEVGKDGNFIAYSSSIVRDTNTGLEWYVGSDRPTTWRKAKVWVKNLNVAGRGWRMPTREELSTLYKKGTGKRNMTPLLKTTGWRVWSGEAKGSLSAWNFDFESGNEYWCKSKDSYLERGFAVRSRR